jgi:hypothetical protein
MTIDLFERLISRETPDAYWKAVVQSGMLKGLPAPQVAEIRQKIWPAFLMLIRPEVYENAVNLGVFPWMDVDPFFSERITW